MRSHHLPALIAAAGLMLVLTVSLLLALPGPLLARVDIGSAYRPASVSGSPVLSNPYQGADFTTQARVEMHAHYIDDLSWVWQRPGPGTISEEEFFEKFKQAGYGFVFATEHDAAILALNHSFGYEDYTRGLKGTLTIKGSIAQRYRGPVGTFSGGTRVSGYAKNYWYDERMLYQEPPHFIEPLNAGFEVLDWEQLKAN